MNFLDPGSTGLQQQLSGTVHRKQNQRRIRRNASNYAGSIETIHNGHREIQDDEVWIQVPDLFNRHLTILCLATYDPIRILLNAETQGIPE
jgi:hypothetical protein